MEQMYLYLKNKLKDELNFNPKKILDIGAWNGFWTSNCQLFWPNAHYTCIEAGAKHKKKLEECADEVHIAVVGDTHRKVNMHLTKVNSNKVGYTKGSSIFPWESADEQTDERDMIPLNSLVGKDVQFDLIKQDVQGAELLIIKGSLEIFQRATYILNEVNLNKIGEMPDINEMNEYMFSIGFNEHRIISDHGQHDQVDVLYWKSNVD
jgi:FkbM family methyltransferase|tara:strand:- start:463 stop:1083 length:621 start_codon:yes stop_codon:yes gene_type:complete